jgi:hypothetical protein
MKELKDMASEPLPMLDREAENACCVWDGQTLLLGTHTCMLQQALVSYHVAKVAGTLVPRRVYRYELIVDGDWKVLVYLKDADGLPLLVISSMVLYHEKTQVTRSVHLEASHTYSFIQY